MFLQRYFQELTFKKLEGTWRLHIQRDSFSIHHLTCRLTAILMPILLTCMAMSNLQPCFCQEYDWLCYHCGWLTCILAVKAAKWNCSLNHGSRSNCTGHSCRKRLPAIDMVASLRDEVDHPKNLTLMHVSIHKIKVGVLIVVELYHHNTHLR